MLRSTTALDNMFSFVSLEAIVNAKMAAIEPLFLYIEYTKSLNVSLLKRLCMKIVQQYIGGKTK